MRCFNFLIISIVILQSLFVLNLAHALPLEGQGLEASFVDSEAIDVNAEFNKDRKSIGYQVITWSSNELRTIIFEVFDAFANIIKPVFYFAVCGALLTIIIGYMFERPVNTSSIFILLTNIIFIKFFLSSSASFDFWIYQPLIKVVFGLPSLVIKTVFVGKFVELSPNPLENLFFHMDDNIGLIANVAEKIMDSNIDNNSSNWAKALLLQFSVLVLQIVFTAVFLLSIWSLHILIILMPILISLAAHHKTRIYFINGLHIGLRYIITPVVASFAMSFTTIMLYNISNNANFIARNIVSLHEFPENFYWHAMFLIIFSILFHLKAGFVIGYIMSNKSNAINKRGAYGAN